MYHMYGSTVLFNTIMAGAKGVIFEHFHTEHFLRAIQHYQVSGPLKFDRLGSLTERCTAYSQCLVEESTSEEV